MPAPVSTSAFDASVRTAIDQLQHKETRYDHVILATAHGSTSRDAPFHLIEIAGGGLDALRAKIDGYETRFALLRVQDRILLVVSLGQGVVGLKRAQVLVQGRALQSSLGAILFAVVTISSASQLTPAVVGSKLQLERFTHVASPILDQSRRASHASTVAPSTLTRAKPSAPSSPEELGSDGSWSRPLSDIGPSNHERAQLSSSLAARAKSLPVTPSSQDRTAAQGIVIHLASDVDSPNQPSTSVLSRPASRPPSQGQQEEDSSNYGSPLSSQRSSTASSSTPHIPEVSRKSHTWIGSDQLDPTRSPRLHLSADERKRLSDERDRLRADEAIREQVMAKLRAEQNSVLKSPVNRTPRLAVLPPLAPPPPFALPPTPPSDPVLGNSPRGPSNVKVLRSPPSGRRLKLDDENNARPKSRDKSVVRTKASLSPRSRRPVPVSEDSHTLEELISEAHSTVESHESVPSSVLSLNVWSFAEGAAKQDSFLTPHSRASSSSLTILPARAKRSASGSATPVLIRSRQASASESVASLGTDNRPCTTSSSRGSIAASSLFDKELPALPSEADCASSDGDEWIGSMDWRHSTLPSSAPPIVPLSPSATKHSPRPTSSADEAELHDLRSRLMVAEARAKAAEHAAQLAIQEAQIETRRLADELARVEQGTRDKMEAEAVRRALWARDQVARDQLDAYSRTKLEVDEKRRRKVIEEQRRAERERAERIREEQEWREAEAKRMKEEYELRIQYLAEREAKLKVEAGEKQRLEEERREMAKDRQMYREKRFKELSEALHTRTDEDTPLLSGWLNIQTSDAVQWKRRWYAVLDNYLLLYRSPTDRNLVSSIPLKKVVKEEHEEEGCVSFKVKGDKEEQEYAIEASTRDATLDLCLMVELVAGMED